MINFEFLARNSEITHAHTDLEFFYIMDGAADFAVEDMHYELKRKDFLIVNADRAHSYTAKGDFLAACIKISFSELCRMMKQNMVIFWCNTSVDNNEACDELRAIVKKITAEHYYNKGNNIIYLNSLYYEFLNVLTNDFLVNKDDKKYGGELRKFDARKHEIEEYIRQNFNKQISLDDLSEKFYLSYAYLSKYIKKHFGMGFAEYVNSMRLDYAVSQLLHSDMPVAWIAMESGFASSAALNKSFKAKYTMTPTEYRKKWARGSRSKADISSDKDSVQKQLSKHFRNPENANSEKKRICGETVTLTDSQKCKFTKNWSKMINMGSAADLLQSDMQRHILRLRDELGFEYVRFWDLYDRDMMLDGRNGSYDYNFSNLDRVLDFLVENDLKPYIELRSKPKKLICNKDKLLVHKAPDELPETPEQIRHFMRKMIIHLLNRYSSNNVETWYFELWYSEPGKYVPQTEKANEITSVRKYLDLFGTVSKALRAYLPDIRLGGGGFSMRYGEDAFRYILEEWKKEPSLPDFITMYCYPYTQNSVDMDRNQSKNSSLIKENLIKAKQILNEIDFPTKEVHVTEWNFSVSSRNILNDNCMKGAYLVKNMIDGIGLADIMGYWVGSDLYAVCYDSSAILNGSGGLLTKDGIKKPAYYAFDFMNRCGKHLRKRGEHYIITDNGAGNYRIVCHNLKNLNYQYGLYKEDEIRIEEQDNLFCDLKKYRIRFELPGETGGKYRIRINSVYRCHGSVQDEWIAMSSPFEMNIEDIEYLHSITAPGMVIQSCIATDGKIIFELTLEPNEISYIHVTYQYPFE